MELLNNMKSEKSFRQKILSLAFPAILENVLHTAVWMVDTAMVGRLSAAALSAVGFGTQVAFALVHIFGAIGIGTSALVARYVGQGNLKDANRLLPNPLVSTIISVLLQ